MSRRGPATGPSGIVVVDKPAGLTSHHVVARLRRILGTRRIGHAGTLDPMATGVLVCGVNRATRLLGHLMLGTKSYRATIRLGSSTVTDDAEGEVVTNPGADRVTEQSVRDLLPGFTGDIQQVPSQVSAIKINGVRSYARARAGERVDIPPRSVTVHRYELVAVHRVEDPELGSQLDLDVEVDCSAGTYIRALARDLGDRLGCGGHLTALRRTRVGPYGVDRAQPLTDDTAALDLIDLAAVARENFMVVQVTANQAEVVRHGGRIDLGGDLSGSDEEADDVSGGGPVAVLSDDQFLALYRPDGRALAVFV